MKVRGGHTAIPSVVELASTPAMITLIKVVKKCAPDPIQSTKVLVAPFLERGVAAAEYSGVRSEPPPNHNARRVQLLVLVDGCQMNLLFRSSSYWRGQWALVGWRDDEASERDCERKKARRVYPEAACLCSMDAGLLRIVLLVLLLVASYCRRRHSVSSSPKGQGMIQDLPKLPRGRVQALVSVESWSGIS